MPRNSRVRETEIHRVGTSMRNEVKLLLRNGQRRHNELLSFITSYFDSKLLELPEDVLNKPISQLTPDDAEIIKNCGLPDLPSKGTNILPKVSHAKRTTQMTLAPPQKKMNKWQTPASQKVPPHHMNTVTPKFNPYAPMSVVRVPKDGEPAMSLTGSPLQVTHVINSARPNVIVPLNNEKVLSVLPERGLRMSQIPEMDDETLTHLRVLNENLNTILSKHKI